MHDEKVDIEQATCVKCRRNYGLTKSAEVVTIPQRHMATLQDYPTDRIIGHMVTGAVQTPGPHTLEDWENPRDRVWHPITNESARCQWCGQLPLGKKKFPNPFEVPMFSVADWDKWEAVVRSLSRGEHLTIIRRPTRNGRFMAGAVRCGYRQLAPWVRYIPAPPRPLGPVPNRYERLREAAPVME